MFGRSPSAMRPESLASAPEPGGSGVETRVLVWSPEPGVVTSLTSFTSPGAAEVDLIELSGSLVELDEAEWAQLMDGLDPPLRPEGTEIIADGGGEIDGVAYSWALGYQLGDLCIGVTTSDAGGSTCRPTSPAPTPSDLPAQIEVVTTMAELQAIVVLADVTVDDVVDTMGAWETTRIDHDGATWFVIVGPSGTLPVLDIVVDGESVGPLDLDKSNR